MLNLVVQEMMYIIQCIEWRKVRNIGKTESILKFDNCICNEEVYRHIMGVVNFFIIAFEAIAKKISINKKKLFYLANWKNFFDEHYNILPPILKITAPESITTIQLEIKF